MEFNIATLEKATRVDLLEQWRFLINRPPPKHISRRLLIQILAWEQQSAVYGGFTKKLSQRLTRAGMRDILRPAFKPGSPTRVDLLEQWRFLISRPPPKHISRRLLIQILAWEQQSAVYGGFTKKLSQRLTRAGMRDILRPAFKPGSRFIREYHGKTHVVEVDDDGKFVWNTQRFKSLSHAARAITGYNVSGFKFFGVKP